MCIECERSFDDVDQCSECLELDWETVCVDCCGDHATPKKAEGL